MALEDQLGTELNVTVIGLKGVDIAEGTRSRGERCNRSLGVFQLRMVEQVKELGPELKSHPLPDRKGLEQ